MLSLAQKRLLFLEAEGVNSASRSVPSKRPIKPGLHQTFCGAGRCRQGDRDTMRKRRNRDLDQYQFTVRPLSKDEGGGYLVEYPDLPGCMSGGETVEEESGTAGRPSAIAWRCSRSPVEKCQSPVSRLLNGANACHGASTQS